MPVKTESGMDMLPRVSSTAKTVATLRTPRVVRAEFQPSVWAVLQMPWNRCNPTAIMASS
jgi:hypothetical protein